MKIRIFLFTLLFVYGHGSKSLAGWTEEISYRSLSTTAQDIKYLQEHLQNILGPIQYELDTNSIDISNYIFGILPSGAPVVIMNQQVSIRLVRFAATDKVKQKINKGYIYLLSARDLSFELNKTQQVFFNSEKGKYFRLALLQEPSSNYYLLDISPESLHLVEKK